MTYKICNVDGISNSAPRLLGRVDTLDTARLWFEARCAEDNSDPELIFELDPDFDAADAVIIGRYSIRLYTVEKEKSA